MAKEFNWAAVIRSWGIRDVVDVGANIGGWLSFWFEAGARRVIAVEPVPEVFERLSKRYAGDPRVVLLNLGLSDRAGHLHQQNVFNCWTLRPQNDGGLLDPAVEFKGKPPFDVQLSTLDAICAEHGMQPDFVKIDVDGFEPQVLRGASRVLEHLPRMMLEVSGLPKAFGESCEQMVEGLFRRGYRMQSVVTGDVFDDAVSFMRVYPWHTSFDVLLTKK